jgi:hypothetical protein
MSPKPSKYVITAYSTGNIRFWQHATLVWDGKLDQWVGTRLPGSVYKSYAEARAAKSRTHGLHGYRIKIKTLEQWDMIRIAKALA